MGAWIETVHSPLGIAHGIVAPHVGAWIETQISARSGLVGGGSRPTWARGLKHPNTSHAQNPPESRPTWARGLKQVPEGHRNLLRASRPTWARGLKLLQKERQYSQTSSRPTWARGLKPPGSRSRFEPTIVAPHVGAWIENPAASTQTRLGLVPPGLGNLSYFSHRQSISWWGRPSACSIGSLSTPPNLVPLRPSKMIPPPKR